jgi:hypothetical protein
MYFWYSLSYLHCLSSATLSSVIAVLPWPSSATACRNPPRRARAGAGAGPTGLPLHRGPPRRANPGGGVRPVLSMLPSPWSAMHQSPQLGFASGRCRREERRGEGEETSGDGESFWSLVNSRFLHGLFCKNASTVDQGRVAAPDTTCTNGAHPGQVLVPPEHTLEVFV